jgi:hypothetical protein
MTRKMDVKTHTAKILQGLDKIDTENHKGGNCLIQRSILCQEGYCVRCWIFLKKGE